MRRPAAPALLAPLLLALALLSGCSGGADGTSAASGGAAADRGAAPEAAPAVARDAAAEPLVGRSLVRTAELTVQVPDVRVAADRAGALVRGAGGAVVGEETGEDGSTVELRVPPARLDDVLGRLARLGQERARRVGTEDVTEQVVDLDSRLATQRASVARVRALLDRASGLGDVVKIEGELAKREAELESLDARARSLGARVDLASVVLRLEGGDGPAAAPAGFGSGLDAGWTAFRTSARVLAAVAGALLPFLPLLLLAGAAVRWRQRRAAVPEG